MGNVICPFDISQFSDPEVTTHEKLLGLRANVAPDGESTSFAIQFTNQHAFRVHVPIEQIPNIFKEISYATNVMFTRKSLMLDRGSGVLFDLIKNAKHPGRTETYIDSLTLDRVFVFQFLEQAPFAVRLTALQHREMLDSLQRGVAAKMN